jgi:hypothetical protein
VCLRPVAFPGCSFLPLQVWDISGKKKTREFTIMCHPSSLRPLSFCLSISFHLSEFSERVGGGKVGAGECAFFNCT